MKNSPFNPRLFINEEQQTKKSSIDVQTRSLPINYWQNKIETNAIQIHMPLNLNRYLQQRYVDTKIFSYEFGFKISEIHRKNFLISYYLLKKIRNARKIKKNQKFQKLANMVRYYNAFSTQRNTNPNITKFNIVSRITHDYNFYYSTKYLLFRVFYLFYQKPAKLKKLLSQNKTTTMLNHFLRTFFSRLITILSYTWLLKRKWHYFGKLKWIQNIIYRGDVFINGKQIRNINYYLRPQDQIEIIRSLFNYNFKPLWISNYTTLMHLAGSNHFIYRHYIKKNIELFPLLKLFQTYSFSQFIFVNTQHFVSNKGEKLNDKNFLVQDNYWQMGQIFNYFSFFKQSLILNKFILNYQIQHRQLSFSFSFLLNFFNFWKNKK